MKIVVAGGTGFIGHALVAEFADQGDEVTVLSRFGKPMPNATTAQWDGKTVGDWKDCLEGADAVINVVGESVFSHWNEPRKKAILASRVEPTRAIGQAIAQCNNPPTHWLNASAVGYYGSVYQPSDENSPAGNDFLAEVCKQWEAAQHELAPREGVKLAQLRMGQVFGNRGGAFPILKKLTRFFLGSALGAGKEWMAWIHVEDVAKIYRFCIEHGIEGPVNVTGPQPVTNADLMEALRKKMCRPWVPNVPKFALDVASLGPMPPPEVTLASQRVIPKKLEEAGYQWLFPTLDQALDDLLRSPA